VGAIVAPTRTLGVSLIAGAVCAVLPDVDLMATLFWSGGRDLHRTITHSIPFGVCLAGVLTLCIRPVIPRGYTTRLAIYLTLATASHGLLDALTTHETGVAFFSPFAAERYVMPWRPIDGRSAEFWFVFVPLVLITGLALRVRGVRLRWPMRETPLSIRSEAD
jgi:inner membrane protein